MNARAAQRANNKQVTARRHSHAHPPSREELQRQVKQQQREVEKLRQQVGERDQRIADVQKQIADAEKQMLDAEKQIADLERQRVEKPDRNEEVLPLQCKHCETALPQAPEERQTTGDVLCRQIVDLPEVILPVVTEFQYPKLVCPCCQKGTRAEVRSEHAHEIGERLTAVVSYLISARKMTRRDVRATLQDLFGVEISVGSVQKAWEETADAVEAPYTELEEALATEPVLNSDETGSRTNGDKRWVWALCSSWFVFY